MHLYIVYMQTKIVGIDELFWPDGLELTPDSYYESAVSLRT